MKIWLKPAIEHENPATAFNALPLDHQDNCIVCSQLFNCFNVMM